MTDNDPAVETKGVAGVDTGVLVAHCPAAALGCGKHRQNEYAPEAQDNPGQVGARRAESRQFDRLFARETGNSLPDKPVGRCYADELAVVDKAMRPAVVRTLDRTHAMAPALEAIVEFGARHLHEADVGTPSASHREPPDHAIPVPRAD